MTDLELWRQVGEALLLLRTRRGWNPIDIDRRDGPNYGTVQEHERGAIRNTTSLGKHARALGVSVADLLRTCLATGPAPSPEALAILRKFERTTLEGRAALLALARALPDGPEAPSPVRPGERLHAVPPIDAGTGASSTPLAPERKKKKTTRTQ